MATCGIKVNQLEIVSLSSALKVLNIIKSGQIVRIDFKKKDGKMRTIVGRTGVGKFVNGKGARYDATEKGLITIFELGSGYRTIAVDRIFGVKYAGTYYSFDYLQGAQTHAPGLYKAYPTRGRTYPAFTSPMYG